MADTPELFNDIAAGYDIVSAALSVAGIRAWHRSARRALAVRPGQRVLDVGCGTGVVTRDLARDAGPRGEVVGLDPSVGMLAAARRAPRHPAAAPIQWVEGYGENLPFPDASFDRVTAQFSLRNMMDWRRGLAEMRRVLRPGGRLVVLELLQPTTTRGTLAMRALEQITRLLWLRAWLPYRWLGRSLLHAPTPAELARHAAAVGLVIETERHWLGDLVTLLVASPRSGPASLPEPPARAHALLIWATDGSDTAGWAGRWIQAHFGPDTTIHVVTVCPPFPAQDAPAVEITDRVAWRHDLERAAKTLQDGGFTVVPRLLEGEPGPSLLRYAAAVRPDAIVVGQKRRAPGADRLLGSVARRLVAESPWPVILVPPPTGAAAGEEPVPQVPRPPAG
ncbi:MAG: class I SAM-dependent methyltransferase [Actinomycetia bacterium]|nr:class I SAM-dependent methyltransferase [Actinomycetes bacterium]